MTVTFNVQSALDCVKKIFGDSVSDNITADAIRSYIRRNTDIGCTGKLQVKFRGALKKNQQLCACHIKREWFDKDTLIKLDNSKGIY
jgi:hypothetical protein